MKIGIIGGGASGLIAAITAKNENTSVTVYEREKRVGKKILATGNGRCNMTNMAASRMNYHGLDVSFIDGAMKRFWVNETLDFFTECGILWKEEQNGKVYPYSDAASSVLDVLRRRLESEGVAVECGFDVKSVKKNGKEFIIEDYGGRKAVCDRVIIAGGGKASPALGSNGSCYEILKSFGHKITKLAPSLVQIRTETDIVKKLRGIKVNAALTLNGKREAGEILFTDYGLSGPPVFFLSAYMSDCKTAELDLMPEYDHEKIYSILSDRRLCLCEVPLEDFFTGMLNKRVGQALLKSVEIAPLSRLSGSLSDDELKRVSETIKGWSFKIEGTMSWNNAQVTKGGAVTAQFDRVTMQSKLVPGLYACGEVLDIDGDCGGYNLQWAWSSGYLAGAAAGKERSGKK